MMLKPRDIVRLCGRVTVDDAGCWLWRGYVGYKGYGQMKVGGRTQWIHRLAYMAFRGEIPFGMTVNHTCANTSCCNPEHLELLTVSENSSEGNRRRRSTQEIPI